MRRSLEKEMMDLPGNPPELLQGDLANLRTLNGCLGGYRGVLRYLRHFARARSMANFSLLDIGTGGGDVPTTIAHWARSEGIEAKIVGIDLDPVTLGVARGQIRSFPEISLVRADVFCLPFAPSSFDLVHVSQVLHHFSETEIVSVLESASKIARRAVLVSDLIRHPISYYGVTALTRLFSRNEMTRTDAPLSVKRAFTLREWKELFGRADIGPARVAPLFPFRVFASLSVAASHEKR
ncbi:MAG TPA: methyltransferase domain-containing protein [Candidatus Binatia bacterium]|jgi:hypothetical protein